MKGRNILRFIFTLCSAALLSFAPVSAFAEEGDAERLIDLHDRKISAYENWKTLPPEQQAALVSRAKGGAARVSKKAQAIWDAMTPEEQAEAIAQAKEQGTAAAHRAGEAYRDIDPEQRQEMRGENRTMRQEIRDNRRGDDGE